MASKRHVILGGGTAGMNAIQALREFDGGASEVTLISAEPPYARMVLPYYIAGEIPEQQVFTADPGYLERMGVKALLGRRATKIDTAANRVVLDDGSSVEYDDLLIATGSSAARVPVPGAEGPGVTNLWTIDDARRLVEEVGEGSHVLFIGAGFIGFIVLNALAKKSGVSMSVAEIAPQILPRMVDPGAATVVQRWLEGKGIRVYPGTRVEAIEDAGNVRRVKLSSGTVVEANVVVKATGIRPNLDFLEGSGIETDHGILVDSHLRSSVPNVYAAGDVAQAPDLLGGAPVVHAIEPAAMEHGRIVGANMAGQDVTYPGGLIMNVLDVVGLQIASFGRWNDEQLVATVKVDPSRSLYRRLLFDGDVLAGAILLGRPEEMALLNDIGMVKGMIQSQAHLGEWRDYLIEHPMDVRRPYIACNIARQFLGKTLVGRPATAAGYRNPDPQPVNWPYHEAFVSGFAAS